MSLNTSAQAQVYPFVMIENRNIKNDHDIDKKKAFKPNMFFTCPLERKKGAKTEIKLSPFIRS